VGATINPLIRACIPKQIQKLGPERYWYKNPNSHCGFILIEPSLELDWQKKTIQETQPMFYRAELKLPKKPHFIAMLDRRKKQALSDGESQPITETQGIHQHINPSTSQIVGKPSQAGRRGRKPKVDWNGAIKNFVFEQLDHHGRPQPEDHEWSCQADVERAVADHIEETRGHSVSESVVRDHTRRLMSEWEQKKEAEK
jgi:hypothetical protein